MAAVRDQSYTMCDTADSVECAVQILSTSPYLAFDCEGQTLGEEIGRLSILGLASTDPAQPHVYLFDAITLSNDELAPVFSLLRSNEHAKVMFDGRMDFAELLHRHNVRLAHVLDLQLADIESRVRRGEGVTRQLDRLSPYLRRNDVAKESSGYATIHRLNGLGYCVKEHSVVSPMGDTKPGDFTHTRWTQRPLSAAYLKYAAGDLRLIAALYNKFRARSYIFDDKLFEQSERYLDLYEDGLKQAGGGHPLLPLEILYVSDSVGMQRACTGCKRMLAPASFASQVGNKCWMCHAVGIRATGYRPPGYGARFTFDSDDVLGRLRGMGVSRY